MPHSKGNRGPGRGGRGGPGGRSGRAGGGRPGGPGNGRGSAPPPRRSTGAAGAELRLQQYLARAGVASRRASEDLIRAGRVVVNGKVAELGSKVVVGRDVVEVDGEAVEAKRSEWVALNKPGGYVSTRSDPRGRRTVYDLLPDDLHHLFHVGRLDRESEGLLLLTNDGRAANRLLHPRYGTTKEYLVDVDGQPDLEELQRLVEGVRLEDGMAHAVSVGHARHLREGIFRVPVEMREGRNREVRRMFDAIGYPVVRLFRRRFGPIEIGSLAPGRWRRLERDEVERLRRGTGPA